MKKFLVLLCMITCIFGLTACGSEETLTEYEQWKLETSQQLAGEIVMYVFPQYMTDEGSVYFEGYTAEEIEYFLQTQAGLAADGNAFAAAVESFHSAQASTGNITGIGKTEAVMDGNQIVVEVEVTGEKKNATAEIILSNDMFMKLESASLNPVSSMGELMSRAALNTLIGMGTVFVVLILISLIISCFKFISKIQGGKKKTAAESAPAVQNTETAAAEAEEAVDESDDLELAAVISAAIAAYEAEGSTDGFVVRSIRRR